MEKETAERSLAVRKAFAAYEAAVKAAKDIIEQGPPKGLGGSVMTKVGEWGQRYTCSECNNESPARHDWKFCPSCGSEIIRFDVAESAAATAVVVNYVAAPIERAAVKVYVEQGK